MDKRNLTSAQWKLLFELPDDERIYNVPGIAFRAVHRPATRMYVEHVIAETEFGTIRRHRVRGKWQAVEYIEAPLR